MSDHFIISDSLREEIHRAAAVLGLGGVVGMPTETVYGLAANALEPIACARIFEIKGRPRFDPLIVHVADEAAAWKLCAAVPDDAKKLAAKFWPGPLTLVLPRAECVPDIVTADLPTVALRVPDHPVAQALIRAAKLPLAAPSANRFGSVSPTTAQHVRDEFGDEVDCVLDGGPCRAGVESTIVGWSDGVAILLRPGATEPEAIESLIGPLRRGSDSEKRPQAPGMLPRHYAPRTRVVLLNDISKVPQIVEKNAALLMLGLPDASTARKFAWVESLSSTENLREAAANLFATLRQLDAKKFDVIYAIAVPEKGLGIAINDRLKRASHAE